MSIFVFSLGGGSGENDGWKKDGGDVCVRLRAFGNAYCFGPAGKFGKIPAGYFVRIDGSLVLLVPCAGTQEGKAEEGATPL